MKAIAALAAVMAAGLLTACGAQSAAQPATFATASSRPANASASPSVTPSDSSKNRPPGTVTLVSPKTLLGRSAASEQALMDYGNTIGNAVNISQGTKASGVYGGLSRGGDAIAFVAWTEFNPDPDKALGDMVRDAFSKDTFHPVEPGSLNGAARCAAPTGGNAPDAVCMWADSDTFGLVHFLYSTAVDADRLLAEARGEIEVLK